MHSILDAYLAEAHAADPREISLQEGASSAGQLWVMTGELARDWAKRARSVGGPGRG